MGDRANVKVVDIDGAGIYLYDHWGGTELPATLERALGRHERWDDGAYLARIIFCEMLREAGEHALDRATGFGISTRPPDGAYRVLVVDVSAQTVQWINEETPGADKPSASFTDFRAELYPDF